MKMSKRILSVLLAIVMCAGMLPSIVCAEETPVYLAIGDSITSGYGLEDQETQRFSTLLGTSLGAATQNMGVDGLTSSDLLTALQTGTYDQVLASADVISLTIGGNDMMNALYSYVVTAYNLANNTSLTVEELQQVLANPMASLTNMAIAQNVLTLVKGLDADTVTAALADTLTLYSENLTAIVTYIRAVNSDAVILIATQYNPYQWMGDSYADLIALFEAGVTALNTVIKTGAATGAYTAADVAADFAASETSLTNAAVTASGLNLDFHPNAAGHEQIAETMYNAYLTATGSVTATYLYGDVNLDGQVTSEDALAILRHCVELESLDMSSTVITVAADADRNGAIEAADALYCLQVCVELLQEETFEAL